MRERKSPSLAATNSCLIALSERRVVKPAPLETKEQPQNKRPDDERDHKQLGIGQWPLVPRNYFIHPSALASVNYGTITILGSRSVTSVHGLIGDIGPLRLERELVHVDLLSASRLKTTLSL